MNKQDTITIIRQTICDLQKKLITEKGYSSNLCLKLDALNQDYALKIIDILDMIDILRDKMMLEQNMVVKKIEKRLRNILLSHDIHEITFPNNQVTIGKTRVVETRELSPDAATPGTILEICRKGYQCGDKVLRPADVITAKEMTCYQTHYLAK